MKLSGVRGDMERGQFTTVLEWMEHGNIMEFTEKNSANRHWGRGYLETGRNMSGTLQGLEHFV